MAPPDGDSLAILLPVPNLRARVDWSSVEAGLRDAVIAELEQSLPQQSVGDHIRAEHRMTPIDFQREFRAVDGNAFSIEPTRMQSAYLRAPNRVRGLTGVYHVGAGTHPGAGIPGVLLGAKVTAGLVLADAGVRRAVRA